MSLQHGNLLRPVLSVYSQVISQIVHTQSVNISVDIIQSEANSRVMADRLTEIDRKDLPVLRDLYNPGSSRSYTAYVTIDTYIRWFQQDPNIKHLKIYCLNGDFSRGTFVVTVNYIHGIY